MVISFDSHCSLECLWKLAWYWNYGRAGPSWGFAAWACFLRTLPWIRRRGLIALFGFGGVRRSGGIREHGPYSCLRWSWGCCLSFELFVRNHWFNVENHGKVSVQPCDRHQVARGLQYVRARPCGFLRPRSACNASAHRLNWSYPSHLLPPLISSFWYYFLIFLKEFYWLLSWSTFFWNRQCFRWSRSLSHSYDSFQKTCLEKPSWSVYSSRSFDVCLRNDHSFCHFFEISLEINSARLFSLSTF